MASPQVVVLPRLAIKKFTLVLYLFLVTAALMAQGSFNVSVIQNNVRTAVGYNNSVIELEREPFIIEIRFAHLDGIYASASLDTLYYKTPYGKPFPDWEYIGAKAFAEERFNTDKDLIVSYEGVCYWFYDTTLNWYRFDKEVKFSGDTVIATVTVEQLFDGDEKISIALADVKQPLYLVFFATEGKGGLVETGRKKTALVFK